MSNETLSNGDASPAASSGAPSVAPSVAGSVTPSPAPSVAAHETAHVSSRMEHFTRGPTSSGGRNMQDTTFSLSAEYPSEYLIKFEKKTD